MYACMHAPGTSVYAPGTSVYAPGTSVYAPGTSVYAPGMSLYAPGTSVYAPGMSLYAPGTSVYAPGSSVYAPGPQQLTWDPSPWSITLCQPPLVVSVHSGYGVNTPHLMFCKFYIISRVIIVSPWLSVNCIGEALTIDAAHAKV